MEQMELRHATIDDTMFLFELVNEHECRKNSLNSNFITFEEHEEWMRQILCSDVKRQYIFSVCDCPVGQGRLELVGDSCRISYSLIPKYRGCGYGKILVQLLNNIALQDFPDCKYSFGEVLKWNVASQKIFEELGYQADQRDDFFSYRKKIEYYEISQKLIGGGVLLLSNNRNSYILYTWLKEAGEEVYYYSGSLTQEQILFLNPVLIVSYNYSQLIPENIIQLCEEKIINLHISFLPWNRGSDPNFWSFIENTPKGVTIHKVSSKLDRGDILLQKEIFFDDNLESFQSSYEILNREIVQLFKEHFREIKFRRLCAYSQKGLGSYHKREDFNNFIRGKSFTWTEIIRDFKIRCNLKY